MRILFLSPRQSWPPVSGAKLRDYSLAKALGSRAQLTYGFFSEPDGHPNSQERFRFCQRVMAIPAPKMYTPGKILKGIFGPWPLPVVNYTSREMERAVRAMVAGASFDIVHLDSIHMAAYVKFIPGARVVYNWHNIESELMTRYGENASSVARSTYARLTARRLRVLETELLGSAFGHLVCSQREKEQLQAIAPAARIAVIENGVDAGAFCPDVTSGTGRKLLIFVGSMSYHANIDAAAWFTREIWPSVLRRFPSWRLALVGSNPGPAVLALKSESVDVTGTVPSVAPFYADALAAIVPLRTGGGTRLKILEAMAAGVPVISTTLGAEGLAVSAGENILIADDTARWIQALESLSSTGSEARWRALSLAGRRLVDARYDWGVLGTKLFETYRDWLETA